MARKLARSLHEATAVYARTWLLTETSLPCSRNTRSHFRWGTALEFCVERIQGNLQQKRK